MMTTMRVILSFLFLLTAVEAFAAHHHSLSSAHHASSSSSTALFMAPKYDKVTQKWYPTNPELEGPEAGYPLVNTLLLHGPKPFLQRVLNPDEYEQAVLKFMAVDKCERPEAMGNMDAFLKNPNDWAYYRVTYENKGGYKPDYVTLRPKEAVKTVVWSVLVLTFGGRAIWALTTGNSFNSPWF
mmetsp:Transcript_11446/g.21833  ORF Transcript_11446/g.21833 Transcript_11446/m.21833 type:complete len:183 (+) Transcript_11446:109-657(+)